VIHDFLPLSCAWWSNHDATVAGVVEAGVCVALEQAKNSRPSSNQSLTCTRYNEPVDTTGGSVLIVEDDERVRESIGRALAYEGYDVRTAADGVEALAAVANVPPDVIVLDIMMPKLDGLAVCRQLRRQGDATPVLMLTARHEVGDRVAGLDAGADDYLVKPFALDELLARIRALLRRSSVTAGEAELQVADLRLDPARRQAWRSERPLELTKTEFDLLELLLYNAGIVLTRDQIYEHIWGYDFATSSKSLDVYISYLRRKTEADGEPRLIQTVRGFGYTVRAS
jgi:two-component system, OmpR family, response regulator MprA